MAQTGERLKKLREGFAETFGGAPHAVTKGPGRVDLMGGHTDYNEGFVLPVAINLEVLAAGRLTGTDSIRVYSRNFEALSEFGLQGIPYDNQHRWSNYVRGVAHFLSEAGVRLQGMDVAMEGDVPIASGLSSSAAIEMAVAVLFQELLGFEMPKTEIALIGQSAENCFVGVNTGIMDQFTSCLGRKDHALFLDCRTLEHELVPLDTGRLKLVVCDTMKRRGLVDSEYNSRRAQCEEAARLLGVKALRDVSVEEFESRKEALPAVIRKRARHVIYEDQRVLDSREALSAGDIVQFGNLMNASHDSAREFYEVSCKELETMVEAARNQPGCLGARMAGAGFGGCATGLVHDTAVDSFVANVREAYEGRVGVVPSIYVCTAEDGARVVEE